MASFKKERLGKKGILDLQKEGSINENRVL